MSSPVAPDPDPTTNVAVQIASLRGEVRTGLESIKGSLALLVDRTNRTDADVKQLRTDTESELKALKAEIEELKKARWPLAQLGALVAIGGLIAAVAVLFVN
ncbi:hypothetical protein AB0M87_04340 [Streptomyces sp. NPDC051320]|uniref:hypothetical protein n=1 Tax=Streptomyces sp. NPDC051320 TaxID=3154644 RepID=UPI003429C066